MPCELLRDGDFTQAARIERVVAINFLFRFRAFEDRLPGVDDDDVVACVEEWRVIGSVFAREHARHFGRESPHGLPRRINDVPLTFFGESLPARKVCCHR